MKIDVLSFMIIHCVIPNLLCMDNELFKIITEFWTPIIGTIFAIIFGIYVIRQFQLQKQQLDKQVQEIERRNTIDTFEVVDKYREVTFHEHKVIDVLLGEVPVRDLYDTDDKFLDDIKELLNDIEVLALKRYELGLKIDVIYVLVGQLIMDVYKHPSVDVVIKRRKKVDAKIYKNLISFIGKLNEVKTQRYN